jgi:hypothetical protein
MRIATCILLLLVAVNAPAQTYSDQGQTGTSGIFVLPTTTVSPRAQFRVYGGRVSFTRGATRGLNTFGISGGFSSHVEAFVSLSEEQSPMKGALASYAFGGKFLLPFSVPMTSQVALWIESVSSTGIRTGEPYPTNVLRTGASIVPFQNGFRPVLMLGMTIERHRVAGLFGAGVTHAFSHEIQAAAEVVHGYAGHGSTQAVGNIAVKVLPYACLQVGAGYLAGTSGDGAILRMGLSVGTADVDFLPVIVERRTEFQLPTIEEIEQQSREEQK